MKKILFSFLLISSLVGITFAYTPSDKDTTITDTVTRKVETIINKGTSRDKIIRALEALRVKQIKNERLAYLIGNVIERLKIYTVTAVTDGDTIKVTRDGETKIIRMIGLDTPEKYPLRTGSEECYGQEASDFATKVLSGQTVTIESDPTQDVVDKYGRTLAHVFLSGSGSYETFAIREWYGFHYVYKTPSKYDAQLILAETEAKKNMVWVWKYCEGKRKPIEKSGSGVTSGTGTQNTIEPPKVITTPLIPTSFSCSVKKNYCTEMNSCEEAKYYLNFCGMSQLDRNEDGVPCESLCQ